MSNPGNPISFKPSSFYWRKDIGEAVAAGDIESVAAIAEALIDELADHKTFIRDRGFWPPKNRVSASEAEVKPTLTEPTRSQRPEAK